MPARPLATKPQHFSSHRLTSGRAHTGFIILCRSLDTLRHLCTTFNLFQNASGAPKANVLLVELFLHQRGVAF
jgi:hypothetical protein